MRRNPSSPRARPATCVCATAGGTTVKFINICPRCCCGGAGATNCHHSYRAYTIMTWTLDMETMSWVMDGVVDATKVWRGANTGVPRVKPFHPVVSADESNVISFLVCEAYAENGGDMTVWMVTVDTRTKAVMSVCHNAEENCFDFITSPRIPSRISDYFNLDGPSSNKVVVDDDELPTTNASRHVVVKSLCIKRSTVSTEKEVLMKGKASPDVIFAALQEIPGLSREDILQAYRILCHDSGGRRFQSLLGLPVNFWKEWVLLEIKASQACSVCSACTADI
ncbi:hypothetical protein QOZ80_9BG0694690 [Eleusine coracana subsp. coracana]|nr:hypothetical protein QOZ80_9BG0694690 [Eleusine coracana subsp. coracana]